MATVGREQSDLSQHLYTLTAQCGYYDEPKIMYTYKITGKQ